MNPSAFSIAAWERRDKNREQEWWSFALKVSVIFFLGALAFALYKLTPDLTPTAHATEATVSKEDCARAQKEKPTLIGISEAAVTMLCV